MDPLGPVSPGDDVLSTVLSAASENAKREMARRVRGGIPRERPKQGAPPLPALEVIVRNDTGDDLDAFSIAVIQTDTVVDPASIPYEFAARPAFAVDSPDEDDIEQPVILSEPIPADGFGRAVIAGHALAYVWLTATDYEYARPLRADTTRLVGSPGGPVRIVKKVGATSGSRVLCCVELGLDSADGWITAGHPMFDATLSGTGTGIGARTMYERVAVIRRPGQYLCFQPYHGRLQGTPPSNLTGQVYAANLRIGWGGLPASAFSINPYGSGFIQSVCEATTFAYPVTNFSTWRRVNPPAAGGGVLIRAIRTDHTNLPYEVGITWGASFTEMGDTVNGLALPDYFRTFVGLGPFAMVRVPGVEGGNTQSWAGPIAVSPPSPVTSGGGLSASAVDDAYTVPAGGRLDIQPPGVLANDTVPASYQAVLDSSPKFGTLTFGGSGGFVYVQDVDLTGQVPPLVDEFFYHLSDGTTDSPPARVTITITGGTTGHGGFAPIMAGDTSTPTGTGSGAGGTSNPDTGPSTGGGSE